MRDRGVTLPELVVAVSLMGVLAHLSIAPARDLVDRMVLVSAREELVAAFHRARMEARLTGGARLVVAEGGDPALEVLGWPEPHRVRLGDRGVELEVAGSRSTVEFAYGPLGVASLASATLVLRRGAHEATVVVSGYGRVRR